MLSEAISPSMNQSTDRVLKSVFKGPRREGGHMPQLLCPLPPIFHHSLHHEQEQLQHAHNTELCENESHNIYSLVRSYLLEACGTVYTCWRSHMLEIIAPVARAPRKLDTQLCCSSADSTYSHSKYSWRRLRQPPPRSSISSHIVLVTPVLY